MSLRWAHMSFCWFCHAAAKMFYCQILMSVVTHRPTVVMTTALTYPAPTDVIVLNKDFKLHMITKLALVCGIFYVFSFH